MTDTVLTQLKKALTPALSGYRARESEGKNSRGWDDCFSARAHIAEADWAPEGVEEAAYA